MKKLIIAGVLGLTALSSQALEVKGIQLGSTLDEAEKQFDALGSDAWMYGKFNRMMMGKVGGSQIYLKIFGERRHGYINYNDQDVLTGITIVVPSSEDHTPIITGLESKYGLGKASNPEWKNLAGARLTNLTVTWDLPDGIIIFTKMGSDSNWGDLTFMCKSVVDQYSEKAKEKSKDI